MEFRWSKEWRKREIEIGREHEREREREKVIEREGGKEKE